MNSHIRTRRDYGEEWVTREQMAAVCPACADKMEARGIARVKASVVRDAMAKSGNNSSIFDASRTCPTGKQETSQMKEEVEGIKASRHAALRDLREAQAIVAHITGRKLKLAAPAPRVQIEKLPGLSGMQVRASINRIVDLRQQMQVIRTQYESVLKQLEGLEAEEAKGLKELGEAAEQMKQKERYLVEAEKGLLEFTAYEQEKRPGVVQMIGDPATAPHGEKAGAFFQHIAEKLGTDVAMSVAIIYTETVKDLSVTADAIRGLKVVAKTASVTDGSLRKAGLSDVVVSVKEWLSGKVDAISKRIMNFAGDIAKWVKGFVVRTGIVKKAKENLLDALDKAMKDIGDLLAE